MKIQFLGAAREVTGSCFLIEVGDRRVLVECGLIQGSRLHERHNHDAFPFDPTDLDAVVLTHAHLDHSGRLPLLVKRGFNGPIFTHQATAHLCAIMLQDSAWLQEKEAERASRDRKGRRAAAPLYDREDARRALQRFEPLQYGARTELCEGAWLTLRDAGHILGSAIAEIELVEGTRRRRVAFSGDLGHHGAPILRDPEPVTQADLVVMESTYGDRLHRPWAETWAEIGDILRRARESEGNVLVPAFAVGRTQELLYVFSQHFDEWQLGDWQIFLDSPMAIEATEVYARHAQVYDAEARAWHGDRKRPFKLANLHLTRTAQESMAINSIRSRAIIIAGSGMCTGGRIRHHLKHNLGREGCHVLIVGFQAAGTPGRALVDGARQLRFYGKPVEVRAQVHTVGGLSAHADQDGLMHWYGNIPGRPPVALVHGEPAAMEPLAERLQRELHAVVTMPGPRQVLEP